MIDPRNVGILGLHKLVNEVEALVPPPPVNGYPIVLGKLLNILYLRTLSLINF